MKVGVVIVHFGVSSPTRACLASVEADPSPVERTIVIVDNSSDLPRDLADRVHVLALSGNPGYGAGANAGVEALAGESLDAVVILNHDVEVLPGFLQAAVTAVSRPGVGAVGGPLYLYAPDGELWYAGGGVNFLLGTVWQSKSRFAAARERRVGFVSGAAIAVSPEAWRRVGGFDGGYFLYEEDLDLCLRLRRLGFDLRFVPAMAAVHHLGAATRSAERSPLYLEWLTRNRIRPFKPFVYRLYLAALHTPYVVVRSAASLLRGDGGASARALLRGHWDALRTVRQSPRRTASTRSEEIVEGG